MVACSCFQDERHWATGRSRPNTLDSLHYPLVCRGVQKSSLAGVRLVLARISRILRSAMTTSWPPESAGNFIFIQLLESGETSRVTLTLPLDLISYRQNTSVFCLQEGTIYCGKAILV